MTKKLFFLFLCLPVLIFGRADIDKQIQSTSKQINTFDKKYSTLHSKMAKTAKAILKEKKAILQQQKRLQELLFELSINEESYKNNQVELKELKTSQSTLNDEQNAIEQKLVFALARNVSLSMLLDDQRTVNADAMITEEVIKQLTAQVKQDINGLNSAYTQNTKRIAALELRMVTLQGVITSIEKKRQELESTQQANKKALKKLEKDKQTYKASIEKLLNKQDALKKTLAQLNIIKIDEKRKAEEAKKAAAAKKAAQQRRTTVAAKDLPKVKQRGSSYQKIKTKRYRGKKTIAPIDNYKLVKKFGPYTDPIYNIKIFNESVSLKPKKANAKVKNVLNGKVILAQNTSLLDNVVIVEHANGMHTIYAHMDKIAPTVKKGKKIRKGSVIGRVNNELMFEVTQKKYHIDPMQLIR
jgi:murein DD-endopeptidase MepM/ murein hydrolase activator NlpD